MVLDSGRSSLVQVSLEGIALAAKAIVEFGKDYDVWVFKGEMGAGKTTLIKAIGEVFAIEDNVNSPTYSLVNEYRNLADDVFYHFDFYRMEEASEAVEIGVEEYFYSGHYCFVEWPSKIPKLIPQRHLEVGITLSDNGTREIDLIKHD